MTPNLGDSVLADPRLAPLATLPDGVRTPEALRYLTSVNVARGVDLVKTRSTERAGLFEQDPRVQVYDVRQIRAVVDAARRLRGGVACHGHGDEGIRDSILAGVRSVEHGTFASAATLDLMRPAGPISSRPCPPSAISRSRAASTPTRGWCRADRRCWPPCA